MTATDTQSRIGTPFAEDSWFRPYFLYPQLGLTSQKLRRSLGSGTIVSDTGLIVTSARFIENRTAIKVVAPNYPEPLDAEILGEDHATGLAVLRVVAKHLQEPKFGDPSRLEAGDLVFAIGNPLGLEPVVSMGVISNVGKQNDDEKIVQSDLFIHGGNIGGAIINSAGEVLGVPVRLRGMSAREPQGGFFLPIDRVKSVAERIERYGNAREAWLGVAVADLTQEMKSYYSREEGVIVTAVEAYSPSEIAGIKRGDLLLLADSLIIASVADFERIVSAMPAGKEIVIMYIRDRRLGETAMRVGRMEGVERAASKSLYHYGMALETLTPTLKERLKIGEVSAGVVITNVDADSLAAQSGFMPADVIVQAEGIDIASLSQFQELLGKTRLAKFIVMRDGLSVELGLAQAERTRKN
jgi:serine protease Do